MARNLPRSVNNKACKTPVSTDSKVQKPSRAKSARGRSTIATACHGSKKQARRTKIEIDTKISGTGSNSTSAVESGLATPPPSNSSPPQQAPGLQPTSSASQNTRCSDTLTSNVTTSLPPTPAAPIIKSESTPPPSPSHNPALEADETRQPTINWDCTSSVVSDQKIHTSYSKPLFSTNCSTSTPHYGKMVTKTVTMTVTTTIATTEILRPGEEGYEASVERQKRQAAETPQERERRERGYRESRRWASGDKSLHEGFHHRHHRSARPAPARV